MHRPLLAQAHRKLKEALPICCIGPSTEAIDQSQCLLGQGFQALRGDRLWGHFLSRCVLACGCGGSGRDLGPTWSDGVWNRTAALAPQTSASSTSCACPAALDACAELLRAASSGRPEHGEPFGRIGIVGESDEAKSQRVVGLIDASLALLADDSLASALVARWVQLLQAPGWDCVKSQGPCSRDSAVRLLLRYRGALQVTAAAAWDTPALPLCSASALLRQLGALARKPQVGNGKVLGRGRRRRLTGGDEAPAVNVGMEEALQGTAILARLIRGSAEAAGGRVNDMTASLNAGVPLGMLLPCGSDEAWVSTCRLVFDEARALTVGAMGQGGCVGSQYLAAAAAVSASASVMEAACLRLLGRLPRSGLEGLAQGLVRRAGLRPQSWEPEAEVELDTSTCRAMRNMRISGSIWIPMDEWEPSTSRQSNGMCASSHQTGDHAALHFFPMVHAVLIPGCHSRSTGQHSP